MIRSSFPSYSSPEAVGKGKSDAEAEFSSRGGLTLKGKMKTPDFEDGHRFLMIWMESPGDAAGEKPFERIPFIISPSVVPFRNPG
jgi:hypothetical protein